MLPVPNTATVDADFELMQPGNPALNQPVAELRAQFSAAGQHPSWVLWDVCASASEDFSKMLVSPYQRIEQHINIIKSYIKGQS